MKPIPEINQWGFFSEYFLECGEDGIVRVKDGRTLEEYLNDPRFVERRKGKGGFPMVICDSKTYERALIPHCA